MNTKQGGYGPAILAGVIVGTIVGLMNLAASNWWSKNDTLVAVATKVEYLTAAVNKLTEQPYVRRPEFDSLADRVSGLNERVDSLEQRSGGERRRQSP